MVSPTDRNPELNVQKVARPKGAVNIPEAKSTRTAQPSFTPPKLMDGTRDILKSISNTAQNYLDKKAQEAGEQQGAQAIEQGADIKEIEKKPNTIYGSSYKNSARTAFIAKTQTRYETQLAEALRNNSVNIEAFTKEVNKIRNEVSKSTPSSIQAGLLQQFDADASKYTNQVNNNIFAKNKEQDLLIINDRLNLLSNKAYEATVSGDIEGANNAIASAIEMVGNLVHTEGVWGADEIENWRSDTFGKLLAAEIKRSFEFKEDGTARTYSEKQDFIKELADGGYKKYVSDLQEVYGKEIQKILPELTIPNDLNMSETADVLANIEATWKEYKAEFQSERALVKSTWSERQKDGEIISEAELTHAQNSYFMDDEELEVYRNFNRVNEYVKINTSGLESKTMSELQTLVEDFEEKTKSGVEFGGDPVDVNLGIIANDIVISQITKRMEALDDIYQNFGKNGYQALGINIDADLRNILNTPANDGPPGTQSSPLYNLKKARAKAANILGVNEQDLPLVTTNQIQYINDQIGSKDIAQIDEALNTLTDIKANYNLDMMNELALDPHLIVAMEMPRGTVERNILLASFVNKDSIAKMWPDKGKDSEGNDINVIAKLSDENELYQDTVLNTGIDQQQVADSFLEPVIKYMMLENGQDFETASANAMNMWTASNDLLTFGDQTIYVNKSLSSEIDLEATQELIEDIYDNPMLYNYNCGEDVMTLTQCQQNFAENTKLRLEGSTLYFVQIDDMYGTDGATVLVNNPSDGLGNYATPLQIELINGKASLPYSDSQQAHKMWSMNPTIPNNIDEFEYVVKAPEGELDSVFDADPNTPGTQLFNFNPKKDQKVRLTLWEHKKKYLEIGAQTGLDPVAVNIAEGGMATVADDMGGMNTGFGTIGENAMALTGISQNAIAKGKFTEREFDMLSDFDDFAELDDGRTKEQIRKYINDNWAQYIEQGGIDGRWTGAKLSPLMTLHILYQDALDELEQ